MTHTPREIHLIGSVPLNSADEVFRTTSELLGERIKKLPDGETGHRKNWINFQYAVLARNPLLEPEGKAIDAESLANESKGEGADYAFSLLRLKEGASPGDLRISSLGYAEYALASYQKFSELKRAGVIRPDARFQLSLPTPLAPIAVFIAAKNKFDVYPAYSVALMNELDQVLAAVPHDELAVQWDVAVEFGLWEGLFPAPPGDWKGMLMGQFARLGNHVPSGVQLGFHLCYGDRGHKHFIEPKDTANLVEVANGISAGVKRSLDWLHLPVPRDRSDDAYFAPLAGLKLHPETKLFLGLVHLTDGLEGTRRRIAAAERVVSDFGIATECGLGRRDPTTIVDLLKLHASV